eukprot:CAMPEP_0197852784 /NCGR_PEP_ID=MMETSP1438-20131217/21391_1 /TAXON_ID=1461541 /ORGANISM="Pterosperma sp., Strain CCMP1384" /LENGTH=231 /DNA_ID=CAMNT_0043466963 /DNA_START=120 /DNA_END=815 /DNA_ORIENTATION=-
MTPAVMNKMSLKKPFNPLKSASVARPVKATRVTTTCSASKEETGKKALAAVLATAVAASTLTAAPEQAYADVAGLTPCAQSKAFKKREKQELKALTRRMKNYEEGSAPALALEATMQQTKNRFKMYGESSLLCGSDGLPHLIVDGDLNHLGEFVIPGLGFLYIAGWIGYAGRSYVMDVKGDKKPTESEIIIDVPRALKFMFNAGAWPLLAFNELKDGELTEKAENITVSPR